MHDQTPACPTPSSDHIAAVVVLYRPDPQVFANIASFRDQVDAVIAVDNTESPDADFVAELRELGVDYLPLGHNRGIAAALNVGCRRASERGYLWALTMDQDSTATPDMVRGLAACLSHPDAARVLLVAPNWQQEGGAPVDRQGRCVLAPDAMTSGNLLRLAGFRALGGFREDFFIDRVDTEFCLRARRHGWLLVQRRDVLLIHRMGRLRRIAGWRPFYVTDYSALRRYYMVRNLLEVRREYGREFPEYVAVERRYWTKELPRILLGERQRRAKVRMMLQGWLDYRRGRFGTYEELHPPRRALRTPD